MVEVQDLRKANEILRKASGYFAQAEFDRPASAALATQNSRCSQQSGQSIQPAMKLGPGVLDKAVQFISQRFELPAA